MALPDNKMIKAVIIFSITYLCLSGFFYSIQSRYIHIYKPLISPLLTAVYPDFLKFSSAKLAKNGKAIQCSASIQGEVIKNGKPVKAEISSDVSIDVLFISLYPTIILSLIFVWPTLSWKLRIISILLAAELIYCVTLLDLSLTLMSTTESRLQFDMTSQDLRKFIVQFFNNGGRQFASLIIAWSSIRASRWAFG